MRARSSRARAKARGTGSIASIWIRFCRREFSSSGTHFTLRFRARVDAVRSSGRPAEFRRRRADVSPLDADSSWGRTSSSSRRRRFRSPLARLVPDGRGSVSPTRVRARAAAAAFETHAPSRRAAPLSFRWTRARSGGEQFPEPEGACGRAPARGGLHVSSKRVHFRPLYM